MVGADPDPIPARPPTADDVRHVCRALNAGVAR
jgi:hypothetical protein